MFKILVLFEKNVLKNRKVTNYSKQIRLLSELTTKEKINENKLEELKKRKDDEKNKNEERKRSEKYQTRQQHGKYYKDEERKMNLINYFDEFFETNILKKDSKTFISAIEAFNNTNKNRQLYIDFIYAAIQKMKEYNADKDIEAYRKLIELFPKGPLRMQSTWQREMMHFPRHQNCVIYILENMENNKICPDTDMLNYIIDVFGDWTHAVKKAKRQLYWMPKFKYANRYSNPFLPKLVDQLDLSIAAIERMTSVDLETKININLSKEINNDQEDTWIVWAQSTKQKLLLKSHNPKEALYVTGPHKMWLQENIIEYFILKSEEHREIDEFEKNDTNFEYMENVFTKNLSSSKNKFNKKRTVHEQNDGTIFSICCTGTGTRNSIITWTKILQRSNECLKDIAILYKIKDKSDELIINNEKEQEQ